MATSTIFKYYCPLNQGRPQHFYRDPRVLDCLHSFCKDCLKGLSIDSAICCPTCSKVTSLSEKRVHELPRDIRLVQETAGAVILSKVQDSPTCEKCTSQNPATNYCLDCGEFLCIDCELVHQRWKDFMVHARIALTDLLKHDDLSTLCPPVCIPCPRHHLEMGSHYCLDCKQFGCYKCDQHRHSFGLEFFTLDKAAKKTSESLTISMKPATDAVTHLEEHFQEVKLAQDKLKEHADKAKVSINVAYDDISAALKKHKQTLLAQVDVVVATKSTLMCIQNEKLEEKKKELSFTLEKTQQSLETYSEQELLAAADLYETALTETVDDYKSLLPLPRADNFLEVAITPLVQLSLGVVNGGCCPAATIIVGYQTNRMVRGRERIFVVEARDESGCPYGRGGEKVSFALVDRYYDDESRNMAERTREMKMSNVVDCGNGRYKISVTAPLSTSRYKGAYDLFVNVRMLPIKCSPIEIYARNARKYSENTSVNYKTTLSCSPACVAPGHNTVYVTTYLGQQIYKMNLGWYSTSYDEVYRTITVDGAEHLHAIATLGKSTIFVTDCGSNEVIKLTEDGEVQARFGTKGSEKGQFDDPKGLAVDEEGRIFVGESGNKRIQVFNPDSSHRLTIPLTDQVQGIALDTSCNIHATQFSTGCIKVYSSSGQYVREYGKSQLDQPHNVFVDEEDFCFVTDRGPNPVKIFDQQGTLIHSFGSEVKFADGVCISPYGQDGTFVYVCDREEKLFIRYL